MKALRSVRRTHEFLVGLRRMNGFIEVFFIMATLAKLSFQTVKEEKTRRLRNKLGGLNLSDRQERGFVRLNFP